MSDTAAFFSYPLAMASGDLRKELECSVCLSVYTDPVNLKCGHNFCRVCIDRVLDTQEGAGGYSCPECREEFEERPALQRNITLRNIMEKLRSTQHNREEIGILCTYCVDSPVAAVKSCLLCEASLCEKHLRVHSKSPEHVITDPSTSPGNRKCPEHMELLKYYCTEDAACVCVSCYVTGEHRGHQMESLDKACEKRKLQLRNVLQKMSKMRERIEDKVQRIQEHRRKVEGKAVSEAERVVAIFRHLRRQLGDLEKRILSEIRRHTEQDADLIQQLEIQKDELCRKMRHIEELCNLTDPLTVLQEPDTGDLCDPEEDNEDRETDEKLLPGGGDLDVPGLSHTLHDGLSNIVRIVNSPIHPADLVLDIDTAHHRVRISDDGKIASYSCKQIHRPPTPARFLDHRQVLSRQSCSSGRHYWEVDVGGSDVWAVGMCYPSIDRRGDQSLIGYNNMSWSLWGDYGEWSVRHNSKVTRLPFTFSSHRVGMELDYDNGRISFYDLCQPVRKLHTFTTTFTEPLHAALCIWYGRIKISGGGGDTSDQGLVTAE